MSSNKRKSQALERDERCKRRCIKYRDVAHHIKFSRYLKTPRKTTVRFGIKTHRLHARLTVRNQRSSFYYYDRWCCRVGQKSFNKLMFDIAKNKFKDRIQTAYLIDIGNDVTIADSDSDLNDYAIVRRWQAELVSRFRKSFACACMGINRLPVPDELIREIQSYL